MLFDATSPITAVIATSDPTYAGVKVRFSMWHLSVAVVYLLRLHTCSCRLHCIVRSPPTLALQAFFWISGFTMFSEAIWLWEHANTIGDEGLSRRILYAQAIEYAMLAYAVYAAMPSAVVAMASYQIALLTIIAMAVYAWWAAFSTAPQK